MPRSQIVYEEMYEAWAIHCADCGDRDKRLAKSEAEYEAYKNEQKRQQGEQLDIFGEVA